MTRDETIKIVARIMTNYQNRNIPNISSSQEKNIGYVVDEWQRAFCNLPFDIVDNALSVFIMTDTKQFPPTIGNIVDIIVKSRDKDNTMTPMQAWDVVYKAICKSGMYSESEFEKLPDDIKRCVGSPSQLREWAMTDISNGIGVLQSHFLRIYESERKSKLSNMAIENMISLDQKEELKIEQK